MIARNKRWIWGISGTTKYAVKDLTEIEIVQHPDEIQFLVVARKRIGYGKVLLKQFSDRVSAQKFVNETFPSK